MGGAAPLLGRRRAVALVALAGLLAAYYATSDSWWNASVWWDVAWISVVLIPAVFALVYLVLPLASARGLLLVGLALGAVAVVITAAGLDVAANFAKLFAVTALAFVILAFLESLGLVVLVASIIPWVDAWSVWRGPTKVIVTERKEIFEDLSIAFPTPGEDASANLGLPDVLFFALFLEACRRFGLRVRLTWLAMAASFGLTLALSVWLDLGGLPALPGLSVAFLGVNGDLLWRRLRPQRVSA